MNFLTSVDQLGHNQFFKINGLTSFKNVFGGLISLFFILAIFVCSIYFGRTILEKTNPITNSYIENDSSPAEIRLDKEKWDFFFGLQYKNKFYIDETIYTVKTRMYTFTSNVFYIKDIKTEACTKDSFTNNTYSSFSKYNFNEAICISKTQNTDLMLNRLWGQEDFKYIEISLYPCRNETKNSSKTITCQSDEIINKYLKTGVFSIYTIYYNLQTKDFKSPFKMAIFNDFFPVSLNTFTHSIVFLMHSILYSDVGWFIEDYIEDYSINMNRIKYNFYLNSEEDGRFLRFQFQLASSIEKYTRKYMKIQELCALVGGIAKFLITILEFLVYFNKRISIKEYLVNCFYDDEYKTDISSLNITVKNKNLSQYSNKSIVIVNEEKDKDKDKESILKIMNNSNRETIKIIGQSNIKSKSESDLISNSNQKSNLNINKNINLLIYYPIRNKLNLNFLEKNLYCLCSNNIKLKKLKKGYEELERVLTIEQYIKNIRDLKKTRFFLFSQYENELFDKIGNPIFEDKNKKTTFFKMNSFVCNKEEGRQYIKYDEEGINNNDLNDSKILSNLLDAYKTRPDSAKFI